MISIIITAFKEPKTIGKAIGSIQSQNLPKHEIIVAAPDKETLDIAKKYKNVQTIKDPGKGKPAALNLVIPKIKGDIIVLTDGDVHVSENSIKKLIDPFKKKEVGAVTGRPISINPRNNKLGFWAHLLTEIADERRKKALKLGRRFFCSGYLFAIRKELFPKLPEEILSDDGYISHNVYKNNYKILYSPDSKVYVKYPTNFQDWINQKRRSAGGYNQIKDMTGVEMRSFRKESSGYSNFLKYVSSPRELFWLSQLFLSRVYLWAIIYRDINLKKGNKRDMWVRIESTK